MHRFGEAACYDLNKYNFDYEDSIYLSVAQSDNQKTAITAVPNIIGSMSSGGVYFLVAGLGVAGGVLATLGVQKAKKKKEA